MRIRNIKPEITKHEGLADLSRDHRLLFIYLWMLADVEGRLEDRPRRIKADLFPYDDDLSAAVINDMLQELANAGFLVRYEAAGLKVIAIPSMVKHQTFSTWERKTASELPPPPGSSPTDEQPQPPRSQPGEEPQDYGSPAVALLPDVGRRTKDVGQGTKDEGHTAAGAAAAPADESSVPAGQGSAESSPDELQALWNDLAAPGLPRWRDMTSKRRQRAKARLLERGIEGPDGFRAVIERINASPFCRGETSRDGWKATPDWLLQPDTATKVLEGAYDRGGSSPAQVRPLRAGPAPLPDHGRTRQLGDTELRRCRECAEVARHTWTADGWSPEPHGCAAAGARSFA